MAGAVKVFTVVTLLSLPTVMFGGYSLLRLLPTDRLTTFQQRYFRAGHAHAGVLLVLTLVVLDLIAHAGVGEGLRWVLGILLAVGVLTQSGGMFVHMLIGEPGRWSYGNTLTVAGALALSAAIVTAAIAIALA